jgi:hypothetical protein
MDMVVSRQRIASAYFITHGPRGSISRQAQERDVSRQRIYRESAWVQQQFVTPDWQRERQALRQQVAALQQRLAERETQRRWQVLLHPDKQAEFASVGQGIGVSLPQTRRLLAVLLGEETPSVAKLGRWTKAAGEQAGAILAVLDEVARPLVQVAAADEVYVKAPVLMVVEPSSLCWVVGQKTDTVSGVAWQKTFATMPNLEMVVRDAGAGLSAGVTLANEERTKVNGKPLVAHQDHFHSLWEGGRGLGRVKRKARAALAKAEVAQRELDRRKRQGQALNGIATHVPRLWQKAEKAFACWTEQERLWNAAKAALLLVTPEGTLNTPERAERLVREALAPLPDADFGKSKRQLLEPETFTYLREVHRKLDALPGPAELKEAALKQECLRRRPELLQGENRQAAAMRGVLMMCSVVLAKSGEVGQETMASVREIFRTAWRASSLVECVNSVVRMQQARHRRMSQGLIDLKRLYWNTAAFRTGCRRKKSPYEHLGVELPEGIGWWDLLNCPPELLREQLSAPKMPI